MQVPSSLPMAAVTIITVLLYTYIEFYFDTNNIKEFSKNPQPITNPRKLLG